ncbi:MAG: hypothetical protein ACTSP6_10195 [Promethearchaeota archaeon]
MQIYSVSDKGTLTKVKKANFDEKRVFIIDDFKTLYVWFGKKVPESKKALTTQKVNKINDKRSTPAAIQYINQDQEYGAFLAMKDFLKTGQQQEESGERRSELELEIEDTMELIEAGLDPDLEAEITLEAYKLAQEKKSYEELCRILAETQLSLIQIKSKPSEKEIAKKATEIHNSSSTYEELCWLIAELSKLKEKEAFS